MVDEVIERDVAFGHALARRIAADIQAGLLAPGAWLKQIDLQQRYDAPRGDVRRALDELVAKRLVQHVPNQGHHVFALDPVRIAHLTQLRVILEGAVAELIFDQAGPEALARLTALAQDFADAVQDGTPLDQHGANIAFHMAMLALCPNPELAQAVRDTRSRLPSALFLRWQTHASLEQSVQDHAAMLAALRNKDRDGLRRVVVDHLRSRRVAAAPGMV